MSKFLVGNAKNTPSSELGRTIAFPLDGIWYVSNAADVSGSHRWGIGQEFAHDFVKVNEEGNSGKCDETKPESYYAYGQSVLTPADGTVYETRDETSDTPMAHWRTMIRQS